MSNHNNEWEDAKITEDGEDISKIRKRLLEHKVDRKEIMMWNVAIIGINLTIVIFFLNSFSKEKIDEMKLKVNNQQEIIDKQDEKLEKQDSKLDKQDSKLEKQMDEITNLKLQMKDLEIKLSK